MTNTDADVAWMACELIEQVPGKVSGQPIVRETRILPDAIVNSYDLGESINLKTAVDLVPERRNGYHCST